MIKTAIVTAMIIMAPNGLTVAAQDTVKSPKAADKLIMAPETIALKRIEKALGAITSMQANFRMVSSDNKATRGTLSMKKPGYVRFDFGENASQLFVSNGKTLSVIDYEIGKVERVPVKDTPLSILLSEKLDLSKFNSRVVVKPDSRTAAALMVHDAKRPEMGTLTLYFKKNDTENSGLSNSGALAIDYWSIRDGQGQLTYVMLENQKMNVALDKKLWTFKDPRGAAKRRR